MALSDAEYELLREARDLAKETNQTVRERVVPVVFGDGKNDPGLLKRVDDLEAVRDRVAGATWVVQVAIGVVGALVGSGTVLLFIGP